MIAQVMQLPGCWFGKVEECIGFGQSNQITDKCLPFASCFCKNVGKKK